jgi:cobalt-zinc-cadmium efflux system membrane fusion protein
MRDLVRPSTAALAALALSLLTASCGRRAEKAADPAAPQTADAAAAKPRDLTLDPAQRQKVRLEKVAPSPFHRTIETTGTVAFDQNRATQVLAPISGPVSRILAEVGARVGRGQSLATVASPDFAVDVSALRKAEATAKNARRVADLDAQLWKNDAIARRDLEQAETDAVAAEADRDAALQQLRDLGVDARTLSDIQANRPTTAMAGAAIRSPLAGTVVEKLITPGQLLQAGTTPCFTVADLSTVWVMANVFESDLPFAAPGDTARVMTGAPGPAIQGKVDYIAALVDPSTRAVAVRIVAPNPNEVLKRDLYVRAEIESRRESRGLLVPVSAVLRDDENLPILFVANPDGSFARRRVQIGTRVGDRQEITSGLAAGETIVVEGGLFLQFAENQ